MNPYVSGSNTQPFPERTNATPMITAPPATMRAEVSLTGLGKLKNFDMLKA
jgi:hypothetical protein